MNRCLSDAALMRSLADLGSEADRAHLRWCAGCIARRRDIQGDVGRIGEVLLGTPEPLPRAAPRRRRSLVMAGLIAMAAGGLLWIEVAIWKTLQTSPDPSVADEVQTTLTDVTASLFSVDGEPGSRLADRIRTVVFEPFSDDTTGCDGAGCAGAFSDLETPLDWDEGPTMERTVLDTEGSDQGGQ